jgi:hypothetical protein
MSFPKSKVMGRAIRLPKSSLVPREKDRTPVQAPDRSAVTSSSALLRQVIYRGRFGRGLGEWSPSSSIQGSFIPTSAHRHQPNAVGGRVAACYDHRNTAGQWIKESSGAIKRTPSSCRFFAANVVRLQLPALTYSLGNFIRALAVPEAAEPCWPISPLASTSGCWIEMQEARTQVQLDEGKTAPRGGYRPHQNERVARPGLPKDQTMTVAGTDVGALRKLGAPRSLKKKRKRMSRKLVLIKHTSTSSVCR